MRATKPSTKGICTIAASLLSEPVPVPKLSNASYVWPMAAETVTATSMLIKAWRRPSTII